MIRAFLGAAFLTLILAMLPGIAADEKKNPAPKAEPKVEKKENPYVPAGRLTGTIMHVEESKRSLRIDIGKKTVNPVAQEAYNEALKAHRKARTQQEKLAALEQVKAAGKNLVVDHVDLQTTDDVVVRLSQPPAQFDEKGRLKKYTQKELKDLKGSSKLPGYQGEFSNLRQRQVVQVTLVKKKEAVRARNTKGRGADKAPPNDNQPMVNMVFVVRDQGN